MNVETRTIDNLAKGGMPFGHYGSQETLAGEMKLYDEAHVVAVTPAWQRLTPAAGCFGAVPQGDGPSGRDGRVYYITSWEVKGHLELEDEQTFVTMPRSHHVRLIFGKDSQTNKNAVTATDVMDTAATVGLLSDGVMRHRNLSSGRRFSIYYDKTITLDPSESSDYEGGTSGPRTYAGGYRIVPFMFRKEFSTPLRIDTSNTGGTVGSLVKNSLFGLACKDDNTGACNVYAYSRVRFLP